MGGCGDLDGRELCDICDGERDADAGNDDRDVLRFGQGPLDCEALMGAVRVRNGDTVWADAIVDGHGPLRRLL